MVSKTERSYHQQIPKPITNTIPNPATRWHALEGAVQWLKLVKLSVISNGTKFINMTVSFNYKHHKDCQIE